MTATSRKRIAILGSTGSIGQSALDVAAAHPDRVEVVGLAAGQNSELLAAQVRRFRPRVVAMSAPESVDRVKASTTGCPSASYLHGAEGLAAVAAHSDVDLVLCASSGTAALEAVLAAIEAGKTVALANKEVLVMAGALITEPRNAAACGFFRWIANTTPFTNAFTDVRSPRRPRESHASCPPPSSWRA